QEKLARLSGSDVFRSEFEPSWEEGEATEENPEVTGIMARLADESLEGGEPGGAETTEGNEPECDGFLDGWVGPDRMLGKLRLLEKIAEGGMGWIFKAEDTVLDRSVAVKVLNPTLSQRASARGRFIREARSVAAINHENILPIYHVDEQHSVPCIVMPLVDGEDLHDRLAREGRLSVEDCARLGAQIARGLQAAHEAGIVHRDIKPANVLLEGERLWISDFGLARALEESVKATDPNCLIGTPQFMAPEQVEGLEESALSDLFSLGGILYVMAGGSVPFEGSRPLVVMRRIADESPVDLRERNPGIPDWYANLTHQLLSRDPADRPQSAAEVADRLERGSRSGEPVGRPKTKRRPMIMALCCVGLLVALMTLMVATRPHRFDDATVFRIPDREVGSKTLADLSDLLLNGDVVEVAVDGEIPIKETIDFGDKAITLRAAPGFEPVFTGPDSLVLFSSRSSLVLEGIGLSHQLDAQRETVPLLWVDGGAFLASHCDFSRLSPNEPRLNSVMVFLKDCQRVEIQHSKVTSLRVPFLGLRNVRELPGQYCRIHSNFTMVFALLNIHHEVPGNLDLDIQRNFLTGHFGIRLHPDSVLPENVKVVMKGNLLDVVRAVMWFQARSFPEVRPVFDVVERRNVFRVDGDFLRSTARVLGREREGRGVARSIVSRYQEWKKFWRLGRTETVVLQEGEDLRPRPVGGKKQFTIHTATIEDFRVPELAKRYPGRGLVAGRTGPGAALESARETPEFMAWRKKGAELMADSKKKG
ncbi:MAG: serine/threonine-protein kinase, partial [Verrucomicrobiota bacterium]